MQTLPESKNTIAQIAEAAEAFSSKVVESVMLVKGDAKVATDIDSLLKMASLFAESTMT
jgi:hypothetical protein